jgi:hypothetical protein
MNWLTKTAGIALLSAALLFSGTAQSRANTLDVVVVDSLWGAAVGGIAGLSIGLLSDDDDDEIFSEYMVKGMGVGALGGLLYGLFDYGPYYGYGYLNNGQPKGLVHFDPDEHLLAVRPSRIIPRRVYGKTADDANWRFDLFSTAF